jgi:hypothetical protein
MDLICHNCKKAWDVSQAHILGAKLKFALGFKEQTFVCPNCKAKNVISEETFKAELAEPDRLAAPAPAKPAAPVGSAAPKPASSPAAKPPAPAASVSKPPAISNMPRPGIVGMSAPARPVVGAGPAIKEREGVVIVRSLRVRKDHNTSSEILAGLVKGEKVKVIGTWADDDNVWAQLGPDRWAAVVYNGEALIELSD